MRRILSLACLVVVALVVAVPASADSLIAVANGNWTSSATWGPSANTQLTVTNQTNLGTTYVYSSAFTITSGQTVDGVAVFCQGTNASPTGTMDVALSADGGTTATRSVNVNISAISRDTNLSGTTYSIWQFFKFTAAETSVGGTNYKIGMRLSVGATGVWCSVDSTAGNWVRVLRRTDTTVAPAAADLTYVLGEHTGGSSLTARTVTMDNASTTAYGALSVASGGTLTYSTAAATQLRLAGLLSVQADGVLNIGTSGSPIPRGTTAVLEFDCSSDGQYGLLAKRASVVTAYGQSPTSGKTATYALLTSNVAAGGGSPQTWNIDTDTGWKSGDDVAIAPTTRTRTEGEARTLNADAGASSIQVTAAATNAHLGTAPVQAEVGYLTRNVIIRSVSTTNVAYIYQMDTASFAASWTLFRYLGTNVTSKRGAIETDVTTGSFTLTFSAIRDTEGYGLFFASNVGTTTITLEDNVLYNVGTACCSGVYQNQEWTSNIASSFSRNIIIGAPASDCFQFQYSGSMRYTIVNNRVSGCNGAGFDFAPTYVASYTKGGTFSGNVAHSSQNYGFFAQAQVGPIWTNNTAYRNGNNGLMINGVLGGRAVFDGMVSFGNTDRGMYFNGNVEDVVLSNCLINGDTSFAQTVGIDLAGGGPPSFFKVTLDTCELGTTLTGKTTHTTADIRIAGGGASVQALIQNTKLSSATTIGSTTNLVWGSRFRYQTYQQTPNNHKVEWYLGDAGTGKGTAAYETSVVDVTPAVSMVPGTASFKLDSAAGINGAGFLTPVDSGQTVTVHVKVRKDASYNGAAPRLIVQKNTVVGVTADTVLATCTAAVGSWTDCTGTTVTTTAAGVLSFVVDCDGTAGTVYIDTGSIDSPVAFDGSNKYWFDGLPIDGNKRGLNQSAGYSYWSVGIPRSWGIFSTGGGGCPGCGPASTGFPALFLAP